MIDEVRFYERLREKAKEVAIDNPQSVIGKSFNDGLDTLLSYAYIIASEMYWEAKK